MRATFILLLLPLLAILPAKAQDDGNPGPPGMPWTRMAPSGNKNDKAPFFSPWDYMQKEEAYIAQRAKLSVIEANFLFPILRKEKEALRQNAFKIRRLYMQANNNLNNTASLNLLKQIRKLEAQNLTIEQQYQEKMLKGISAAKLLRVIYADKHFERFMLRQMFMDKHHFGNDNKNDKK